jgi:hypothetical protein
MNRLESREPPPNNATHLSNSAIVDIGNRFNKEGKEEADLSGIARAVKISRQDVSLCCIGSTITRMYEDPTTPHRTSSMVHTNYGDARRTYIFLTFGADRRKIDLSRRLMLTQPVLLSDGKWFNFHNKANSTSISIM